MAETLSRKSWEATIYVLTTDLVALFQSWQSVSFPSNWSYQLAQMFSSTTLVILPSAEDKSHVDILLGNSLDNCSWAEVPIFPIWFISQQMVLSVGIDAFFHHFSQPSRCWIQVSSRHNGSFDQQTESTYFEASKDMAL